ncbi:putative F-box/kelch-repeat protein [Sesbania bispinosa]|nr:putative F-box/kelch-repeat protein [Sesbania bispinosa]
MCKIMTDQEETRLFFVTRLILSIDMLEGPSFLVSRDLPSSCQQETEWIYNTFRVMELTSNKRRLELEEEAVLRKSCKLSDAPEEGETKKNNLDLFLSINQANDQNHAVFDLSFRLESFIG